MKSRRVFAQLVAVVLVAAALALSPQPLPGASAATWFADDFSSGGFGAWGGVTNLSIDTGMGNAAPPSRGRSRCRFRRLRTRCCRRR